MTELSVGDPGAVWVGEKIILQTLLDARAARSLCVSSTIVSPPHPIVWTVSFVPSSGRGLTFLVFSSPNH